MARYRSFHRARPAYLLAGLALLSSVGVPMFHTPVATAETPAGTPAASAQGDFNGDGYADLAAGVPLEDIAFNNQGAVNIIYGSANGLDGEAVPAQILVKNDAVEGPADQDGFGLALAVGDFNGDGFGDLAVGANGDNIGAEGNNEGSVTVFYGSAAGLVPETSQYLTAPTPTNSDQFGFNLAAGDFDGDGRDELAVSVLHGDVGGQAGAGLVLVFPGGTAGLDTTGVRQLDQDQPGTENEAAEGDRFGIALATGDVNGDGRADLAVGVPGEDFGAVLSGGAVHLFFGCAAGPTCQLLDTVNDQYLHMDVDGVKHFAKTGDNFGDTLAMADFGRGPGADLAVGLSWKDVNRVVDAGMVAIFYGTPAGLTVAGEQVFHMAHKGVPGGGAQAGEAFGSILAAGNVGRGPQADLAVGMTYRDVGGLDKAGAVMVFYGSPDGLKAFNSQYLTQAAPEVPGDALAMSGFGKGLLIADFGRSADGDLAIASREAVNGMPVAGAVAVLYGSELGVGTPGAGQLVTQDTPGVPDTAEPDDLFGGTYGQPGLAG